MVASAEHLSDISKNGPPDLICSHQFPDLYPELYTKNSWAWAVKQRANNGLSKAFHKVGKKLFVDPKALVECIKALPGDDA